MQQDCGADVEAYTNIIKEAYENSLQKVRNGRNRRVPYWWNEEIESTRKTCIKSRRKLTKIRRRDGEEKIQQAEQDHKNNTKELRNLIKASKKRLWGQLCVDLEEDIWGDEYKIVTGRLIKLLPVDLSIEKKREIAGKLFPIGRRYQRERARELGEPESLTEEELMVAVKGMRNGRAPGPNRIPAEAIREAVKLDTQWVLRLMNSMLERRVFPEEWKVAKLVLIPKSGKPPGEVVAHRPICLLNTMGKLYEALVRNRMAGELEISKGLSERQFGFRKGCSMIQAVEAVIERARNCRRKWLVLVVIDVRNAFNTAAWDLTIQELKGK